MPGSPASIDYAPIGAKWSATAHTPSGPLTAIGDTRVDARIALEQLIVIARALELSHRHRHD